MIHLENGELRLDLLPELGACVWSMDVHGASGWQPVLMPDGAESGDAGKSGMFWMLPFANRARRNRLHDIRLSPNTAGPLALHGTAWQRRWHVETHDDSSVQLVLRVDEADAPYPFSARLRLEIRRASLMVQMRLFNEALHGIPVGMGAHPYFPRRPGTQLQFEASHFYLEGPDHLPTEAIRLPREQDFSAGANVPATWRNNAYGGWNGQAVIRQPDLGYQVTMNAHEGMRELMLYTAPGMLRFALEPQTHTSGATLENPPPPQAGLTVLPAGQVLTGTFSLTVSAIS